MDNDDRQIGRILTRREVLALFGAAGISALVGCGPTQTATQSTSAAASAAPTVNAESATAAAVGTNPTAAATAAAEAATAAAGNASTTVPACVVRPEVTEGPYYVAENLLRSDVRADSATGAVQAGVPFELTFMVSEVGTNSCTPLKNARVEIWHCNAAGAYSDVSDPGFDTQGQDWLRGAQTTDANGMAKFTTIYPGWYSGRAVHIHFKVHPDETKVFTSQLFFDDTLSQQVFQQQPYAAKGSTPDTLNSTDTIYEDTLLLTVSPIANGYAATFEIGIDPSTVGTGQSNQSGPGGPGGPPPSGGTTQPSS